MNWAEHHRRAVERMSDLVNAHDLSYVDELYAPEITWWYVGMPGPASGRDALKERDAASLAAFPDIRRAVDDIVVDDHAAVVRWRLSGTHSAAYGGFPATHRQVELVGCSIFEFEGSQVAKLFVFIDTVSLASQLSAAPG